MKKVLIPILILIALIAIGVFINNSKPTEEELALQGLPVVSPIEHASFVMQWGDLTIYNDPVGAPELYSEYESPDLVLISDIHGDHLSTTTLTALVADDT
ncbi:MAG: MBL fold metallo-hydrolase, partial [Candidatus Paceibacterota bacterium]